LIIAGVCFWAIQQLLPLIPLPEPFARVIYVLMTVVLVIIVLYVILALIAPLAGVHVPLWVR
jgi:hypothetical protein